MAHYSGRLFIHQLKWRELSIHKYILKLDVFVILTYGIELGYGLHTEPSGSLFEKNGGNAFGSIHVCVECYAGFVNA